MKNLDVFAWVHFNMVSIRPEIMCHWLNIDPEVKPVRQKRRVLDTEHYIALHEEIERLRDIKFIQESLYPD